MVHELSVGAMFKNESHGIREWVQHYLHHGVEQIYLIDDSSTDSYLPKIQDYIDQGIIHLFVSENWGKYPGRQYDMYTHYFLPRLKESTWWLICDLDEYVWCPMHLDLKIHLRELVNIGQVLIQWNIFGSNGYIEQPDRIVSSFTRRQAEDPDLEYAGPTKYFVNSNYEFWRLDVHCARFVSDEEDKNNFIIVSRQFYIINHYRIQSKQFWDTVKLTRGDADDFRIRTEEEFYLSDFNDVEDLRLEKQNQNIVST